MDVGQLDRVLDRLDLVGETADLVVGDVGHLFEDELLDLRSHQLLVDEAGLRVHPDMVADADELSLEWGGDLDDPFFVGAAEDDDAVLVEDLLDGDDLARRGEVANVDDVVGLVEQHLLADLERLDLQVGLDVDPHLAPRGVHIGGAVRVDLQDGSERIRRRRQLLDLFSQHGELLARLFEDRAQLLVLRGGLRKLVLRFEEALLENAHTARCVLEASAKDR